MSALGTQVTYITAITEAQLDSKMFCPVIPACGIYLSNT